VHNYGIVGDGRMARHFRHFLQLLRTPCRQWSRRQEAQTSENAEATLGGCDVLLVLISDGAIEEWIRHEPWTHGRTLLHFSGSLITDLARGAHPLMTFGPGFYERSVYESIAWISELPEDEFRALFPMLRNPVHVILPEHKPFYHALCVMAGNFSTLLWQKIFQEFEARLGIPREAVQPYLRQVFANLEAQPERALTGPLQRGDLGTIARNLAALEGDPFKSVYQAFVAAAGVPGGHEPRAQTLNSEGGTA
jgi:hypothetical protein